MLSLRTRQIIIFTLAWLGYAATYFLRKPIGVIKSDLHDELLFTNSQLGMLDMALLFPYAFMQMVLGPLGDKYGARKIFGFGLILSAISMCTFGQWSNIIIFLVLLFINGTAQSQCWPNCSKALGAWFSDDYRDTMFGLFGTCAFMGGIMGTALAVALQRYYGWRSTFLIPSLICGSLGILVLFIFKQPQEVGIEVPGKAQPSSSGGKEETRPRLMDIMHFPVVPEICVAMFCLKVVRYSMYMWLPMYLLNYLNYTKTEAGMYSTMFEIGGVVGSASVGFLLKSVFKGRSLYGTTVFCFLSAVSLVLYKVTSTWGVVFNSVCMLFAGALNCGPDMILGGSVPAQIGEMDNRNAAAAVVGFVNGFGSIGAVVEGPLIGLVSDYYGFSGMFVLMVIFTVMATLATARGHMIYERIQQAKSADSNI